jgi:hypothetical protein
MRTARTTAVLALAALGAGCGVGMESPANNHDSGVSCGVQITLSTSNPAPGDTIAAAAEPTAGGGPYAYAWSVTNAAGAGVPATARTADGAQVDIPIATAGSYHIAVTLTTGAAVTCSASESVLARNPAGKLDQVLLRFVPPAQSGLQIQQKVIPITGGTPQSDLNLTLDEGVPIGFDVTDATGTATADAFVRLIANDRGFEAQAFVRAGDPLTFVLLDDAYDVLVIPDEPAAPRFAPTLAQNQSLALLAATGRLLLDPGVEVRGEVTGADGAPLEGARIALQRGRLPSTLGEAAADGSFVVRVQPGDFGLSVAAPAASGMPDLELDGGITVGAVGSDLAVAYDPGLAPGGDLDLTVRANDDSVAVAGARVTLRALLPEAGTVTVGGLTQPVPGVVRRTATTDAAGRVVVPALPAGAYEVTVEPLGHGLVDDAATRVAVALPDAPRVMQLFRKVHLTGTLARPADLAQRDITNTRVTAILSAGAGAAALGAAPQAAARADGSFQVTIDPADPASPLDYLLVADPPAASGLARALQLVRIDRLTDVDVSALRLPRGLLLAGTVLPAHGTPLAGVYVEATRLRVPSEADPAPRAEAVTGADGRFAIVFCDPDDMP